MGSNLVEEGTGTVVISKPQLDHELTADPEGDRFCCLILYVRYGNKVDLYCPKKQNKKQKKSTVPF